MLTTLGGMSPVDAFAAGDLDVTPIGFSDAGWIAYDKVLGPVAAQRSVAVGDVLRLRHPAGPVRRRPGPPGVRAGGGLAAARRSSTSPARPSPRRAWCRPASPAPRRATSCPPYDPAGAQRAPGRGRLPGRRAGSARSRSSPTAAATTGRSSRCSRRTSASRSTTRRWSSARTRSAWPPTRRSLWSLSWVADYPGPNDFLGVLLGTGSTANQGGWSSPAFDAAIAEATSAADPADATAAYARAMGIVRDEVPMVPVAYGTSFSLVRDGLLGAAQTGTGILRLAGLAWEDGR